MCEDDSVLGVPFYVMEALDGVVITDEVPPALDTADQREATSIALVDALVDLHNVDVTTANSPRSDARLGTSADRANGSPLSGGQHHPQPARRSPTHWPR